MKAYIRAFGNISPQHSLDPELFYRQQIKPVKDSFECIEPDYSHFVDSKMIRRMSRIVKMGVAAALTCLKNGAVENPAAIITATAYGCLEDSSSFLRRMIEFNETMLSPTAFIQSTHNTVGAQIALLVKSNSYNNTIVHRDFSFENALTESMLLLQESAGPLLVGAIDEITNDSHTILRRFGLYKQTRTDSKTVTGNIAGEGAAFFLLDKEATPDCVCSLKAVRTRYGLINVRQETESFLQSNQMTMKNIDLVLTGHPGDTARDVPDDLLLKSVFKNTQCFPFKSLCGDYPTATGFALWFACLLLKEQKAPQWMTGIRFPLQNILIHNHSGDVRNSFLLIGAC